MPLVYRLQCENCGKSPTVKGVLAGWVTTDGGKAGVILPESYLAVKLNSGELECLPHPVEQSTLEGLGFKWATAAKEGRLVTVTFKICEQCGSLNEEGQIRDPRGGCLVAVISAAIVVIALKLFASTRWPAALFVAYLTMLSVFGAVAISNWLRWRGGNLRLRLKSCSHCQGVEFLTIRQATRKAVICQHCRTQNVRCKAAGIS